MALVKSLETVSLSTLDANKEILLEYAGRFLAQSRTKMALHSNLGTSHITQGLDKTKTGNYRISDQSREQR